MLGPSIWHWQLAADRPVGTATVTVLVILTGEAHCKEIQSKASRLCALVDRNETCSRLVCQEVFQPQLSFRILPHVQDSHTQVLIEMIILHAIIKGCCASVASVNVCQSVTRRKTR